MRAAMGARTHQTGQPGRDACEAGQVLLPDCWPRRRIQGAAAAAAGRRGAPLEDTSWPGPTCACCQGTRLKILINLAPSRLGAAHQLGALFLAGIVEPCRSRVTLGAGWQRRVEAPAVDGAIS